MNGETVNFTSANISNFCVAQSIIKHYQQVRVKKYTNLYTYIILI
jgi:hypothetical protein